MAIYPKIETRRAKRRNGAAYQHRRRRSLTGGRHLVIAHGRRMEYQRSHSMFLTHGIARLTAKSWSDRALLPRKRARSAHAQLFAHRLRSPTWSHVCAGPLKLEEFPDFLEPSHGGGRVFDHSISIPNIFSPYNSPNNKLNYWEASLYIGQEIYRIVFESLKVLKIYSV
jgi:hypothetical protein